MSSNCLPTLVDLDFICGIFQLFPHLLHLAFLELHIVTFVDIYGTFWNFSQTKEENGYPS